jgi:hypothetical protein
VTEQEWLTGTDPLPLLEFLRGKAEDRKLRLFAVAAYRLIRPWISDAASQTALVVAERFADRLASPGELTAAHAAAFAAYLNSYENSIFAYAVADEDAAHAAEIAVRDVAALPDVIELAPLLRDVFADPFRPVAVEPDWLTATVTAIARRAYEDQDFALLPVLADALEDGGCADAALLGHLRGPGPHVKGCWALDLLLGKR